MAAVEQASATGIRTARSRQGNRCICIIPERARWLAERTAGGACAGAHGEHVSATTIGLAVRTAHKQVTGRLTALLDRLAEGGPFLEPAAIVLVHGKPRGLGELDRPDRAHAGGAGEHDPAGEAAKLPGIERRQRVRERARDVACDVFLRLAHIDQGDLPGGQALLHVVDVEIDNSRVHGKRSFSLSSAIRSISERARSSSASGSCPSRSANAAMISSFERPFTAMTKGKPNLSL